MKFPYSSYSFREHIALIKIGAMFTTERKRLTRGTARDHINRSG